MKILIISGFLGAGKTTFIKKMAEQTGRQFVIVENEFASLNIDSEMLRQQETSAEAEPQMKIWELTEGCICCSLNLDFAHSVMTIANSLAPDYLIVEPSGVALTSRIVEQLKKISYERIGLLAPVTIVDAVHYQRSSREFTGFFQDQLYTAGTVVLSKSEKLDGAAFRRIKEDLQLGEQTNFPLTHYDNWDSQEWLALLNRDIVFEEDGGLAKPRLKFLQREIAEEERLENISLDKINIGNPVEVLNILELLAHGFCGDVARAKGYFKSGDFGIRFDLVEGDYAVTGCEVPSGNHAVVIGRNLQKARIEELFMSGS